MHRTSYGIIKDIYRGYLLLPSAGGKDYCLDEAVYFLLYVQGLADPIVL